MGFGVTATGAENTTGAAGIWPGTVARDQKLANLQFHSSPHVSHVCCNVMLCIYCSGLENFFKNLVVYSCVNLWQCYASYSKTSTAINVMKHILFIAQNLTLGTTVIAVL